MVVGDSAEDQTSTADEFDFQGHRASAIDEYRRVRGTYADLSSTVRNLLKSALEAERLKPHSIEFRAKSEESFGDKAARPAESDSSQPKYSNPLTEIRDLAGCRIITFFLKDVLVARRVIEKEFKVLETANRSSHLRAGGPGYESYHLVVELKDDRLALAEYSRFSGLAVEIQVRTILQHAWAEIEHDIQYKSVEALPAEIGQRFAALAGMIEIGDREFQAISDAHEKVRRAAVLSLARGRLQDVELTPETLKAFLDQRYGPDGRMRDWSYEWTTRLLKRLGFRNLQQVADCIEPYSDDEVNKAVYGSRQGQLNRFEAVVLASIGPDRWKALHPWANPSGYEWFDDLTDQRIARIRKAGIPVGTFVPA